MQNRQIHTFEQENKHHKKEGKLLKIARCKKREALNFAIIK
jgi:hypothetical protein